MLSTGKLIVIYSFLTQFVLKQNEIWRNENTISNHPRILCELIVNSCMGYTRGLGTNLLWSAILIYLACGERGNEGIIHLPKDESEFLAKKKIFEANIKSSSFWKGSLFQSFGALQIKILTISVCSTICDVYVSWKFFTCQPPIPLGNFYLLTPPHPSL